MKTEVGKKLAETYAFFITNCRVFIHQCFETLHYCEPIHFNMQSEIQRTEID